MASAYEPPAPSGSLENSLIAPPSEFLPLERALRPAQDLDAIQVEQVEIRAEQARVIHVIDVNADAGLEGWIESFSGRHRG